MIFDFNENDIEVVGEAMEWLETASGMLIPCTIPQNPGVKKVVAKIHNLGYITAFRYSENEFRGVRSALYIHPDNSDNNVRRLYEKLKAGPEKIPGSGNMLFRGEGMFPYFSWIKVDDIEKAEVSPPIQVVLKTKRA